jgi:regulator of protease activity HflC (stomatin/prohibitin superfamily)
MDAVDNVAEGVLGRPSPQAKVVDAERQVSIADVKAKAMVKSAEGQAQAKTTNAQADATVLKAVGEAEAGKTKTVGGAEAEVIKLKIASMESDNYAGVRVAGALAKSGVRLVPDIVAGGSGGAPWSTCCWPA